jgi:glycosyltransferase involved in cell wall biosynthesis
MFSPRSFSGEEQMAAGNNDPSATRAPDGMPQVVFLSSSDPLDIRSFSTVLVHMVGALREQFPDMEVLRNSRPRWFGKLQRLVGRATRKRADPYYWTLLNKWIAARLARRWRGRRTVVIGVVNSTLVAELAAHVPVINVSDATFALMRNFYASFENFDTGTARAGERAEKKAIVRSVHNCFSSGWAARSAVEHYGARPENVSVIPWGCNLPFVEPERARLAAGNDPCRLLFIGGDWQRKGGDLVLETVQLLQKRGFPVTLDIVGAQPPGGMPDLPGITHHGFLSKGDPAQFSRLHDLYRDAAFLFLPTRQDCTPMVFSEANAYGTPALSRDVGGVGGVIEDGVNGYLMPYEATPEDFANRIERSWTDRAGYDALRESSRNIYETRLNWPVWAREMRSLVETLAASGKA